MVLPRECSIACHRRALRAGSRGSRRPGGLGLVARGLWFDLPGTYRLLVAGEISKYVAPLVVTKTRAGRSKSSRAGLDGQPHTLKITTPTGHTYLSSA